MKNGTLSSAKGLVLVDSSNSAQFDLQDKAEDDVFASDLAQGLRGPQGQGHQKTLVLLTAISVACLTGAVAAGSYAFWLLRQQSARQALTDVSDILKSCQVRMQQLEAEVQRLPGREA